MSVARPHWFVSQYLRFEDELRPFIEPVGPAGQHTFVDAYREPIAAARPPGPTARSCFPRLFIVARRG